MMFNARRLKMNRSTFSAFFVAATLAASLHNATAQAINATMQTAVAPRGGEPQRASDGGKAGAIARGAAGRSPANRFKPSKV